MNSISSSQLTQWILTEAPASAKLTKIAKLYADVFADPPWNEYKICGNNHFAGREATELCSKCKSPLSLAYPEEETVDYIAAEISKPSGTLILFEDEEEVVAAGWGYACGVEDLKAKYQTEEMKQKVEGVLKGKSFFYVSEVMVDKRARNQKIATKIVTLLQEKFQGLTVLRTLSNSPMARIAGKTMDLIMNEDSEIEGRVLFMSRL